MRIKGFVQASLDKED